MKWKTQGDHRHRQRRVESWAVCDPDPDSPQPSWRGGLCERSGPSLYKGSHRIEQEDFSQKEKRPSGALWGIPLQQLQSLIHSTTCQGTVRTSSRRELRLQAPDRAGCPTTRECSHLISEGAETTGTTRGRVPSEWECLHLISE